MLSLPGALIKLGTIRAVGVAAGLLGIWWAIATGWEKWEVFRTRGWPVADGLIGEITVKLVDGGSNGVDYWKLTFSFTYTAAAEHTGTYSLNLVSESLRDRAQAGLEGKTVRVHYNPKDEAKYRLWEDEVWDLW